MNKFLPGFGTALLVVLVLIVLSYIGLINLPLLYPVTCSTQDGTKVGTVVLQKKAPGDPAPRVFCRVY
jgi:hypothetical protein